MLVDVHTHYLPGEYLENITQLGESVGVETRGNQMYVSHPHDTFPLFAGFTDLEERVAWMDRHGIDVGLLSNSKPNPNDDVFSTADSVTLARTLNDGFAEARDAYPDRLDGLGVLPLRDVDAAVAEVDRIVNDLGLAGISMHTTVNGNKLSTTGLRPVFERIDEAGLAVFMHPGYNCLTDYLGKNEWIFNPLVMFPTETAFQISRLVYDGFFDRHTFPIVLAHLGGVLPFLAGRIELGRTIGRQRFDDVFVPERPFTYYLQDFYYDAIIHHQPAMQCAVETVGPERILFGTDYPFESEDVEDVRNNIDSLDVTNDQRARMFGETAKDLFNL